MNATLRSQPIPGRSAEHESLGRIPYITIRAFCETPDFAGAVSRAAADRRLSRADVTMTTGGLQAAASFFANSSTPDLLLIETLLPADQLLAELEVLAEVCDAKTKVVLAGPTNDILFYRRLMEQGIADYLVTPIGTLPLIGAILRLFPQGAADRLGKVVAFIGAKGGVGSSTVAQNVAWSLAESGTKVLLADLDLQFGTAALNYDIDAPIGFTEQLVGTDRLDDAVFERLLHRRGENLRILAGATAAREVVQPDLQMLGLILDRARATFPIVILDLPHQWSSWVRQALLSADEVVVAVQPDLANLRNARMLFDMLRTTRPNDSEPQLVLNQIGVSRRTEIRAEEFASAIGTSITAGFAFEPALFSKAANAGVMTAALSGASHERFLALAHTCIGRTPTKKARRFFRWG